jgi:phospho-N-acetylmuramoyl-pentapeptide-transferase
VGLGDFYPGSYFIITAVSNGANLTDGIDGLQQVPQQYLLALGFLLFLEILFSNYLNIVYP